MNINMLESINAQCKELEVLDISYTKLKSSALRLLKDLPKLTVVYSNDHCLRNERSSDEQKMESKFPDREYSRSGNFDSIFLFITTSTAGFSLTFASSLLSFTLKIFCIISSKTTKKRENKKR